jgi:hypothetical protein
MDIGLAKRHRSSAMAREQAAKEVVYQLYRSISDVKMVEGEESGVVRMKEMSALSKTRRRA